MPKGLGCFRFSPSGFCVVELCHGKEDGQDFYAAIAIEPHNYRYFKRRYRPGESCNLASYGYELIRGWGKEPPESVLEMLKSKHGVEFGISENFLSSLISNLDPVVMPLGREHFTNLSLAQA